MKREIAGLWVKALKSGEYKQARNALRKEENGQLSYCCLGVLCDLYSKEFPTTRWDVPGKGYFGGHCFPDLPHSVRTWAGMKSNGGYIGKIETNTVSLIKLNDQELFDFDQIANFIEKHVEEL